MTAGVPLEMLDFAEHFVVGHDDVGLVTTWNRKAAELTGVEARRALGCPFEDLLRIALPKEERCRMEQGLETTGRWHGCLPLLCTDGPTVSLNAVVMKVSVTPGIGGRLVVGRPAENVSAAEQDLGAPLGFRAPNVGEDDLAEQRIRAARSDRLRSLGEMAAGVAHELNQPLQGIRAVAEHLILSLERGWKFDEGAVRDKLQLVVDQTDRMSHIIDHVRVFSREAGRPETKSVDIGEVVRDAVGLLGAQFRARGLDLVVALADGLPHVDANHFSLEEVLINLLTNARDAVEERLRTTGGGSNRIVVRTARSEGEDCSRVVLQVIDHGCGIPADRVARVFDPFFTTKGPDKGTGLGLAVARSIVELFGGGIVISSVPGQGTVVTVTLPGTTEGGTVG